MTKYITAYRSNCIKFDTETEECSVVHNQSMHIDWFYYIDEDGEFSMNGKKQAVKKGDIVVKFYEDRELNREPFIVIRSKEWKKMIETERKHDEQQKECGKSCCDCCEKVESAN